MSGGLILLLMVLGLGVAICIQHPTLLAVIITLIILTAMFSHGSDIIEEKEAKAKEEAGDE